MEKKNKTKSDETLCPACKGEKFLKKGGITSQCSVCKGTGRKLLRTEVLSFQDRFGVSDTAKILIE